MSTLYEVETKHQLTVDVDTFLDRLKKLGYKKAGETHEVDTYYSRSDVDYMKTVECLRVRLSDDYAEITYKPATSSQSKVTAKPETNVRLFDTKTAADAEALLDAIGMIKLVTVDKKRQSYIAKTQGETITVAIDTVKNAGVFVEIEVISADKKHATGTIEQLERELSVDEMPVVLLPYRDIVMNSETL